MTEAEALVLHARGLTLTLSSDQGAQCIAYLDLLLKWNERIRLVAPAPRSELITRHIVDSLAVVPQLGSGCRKVLDVGSGAGLPGVLIAIARPDCEVVALEPIHKKHSFLQAAKRELSLANFAAHAMRVDDFLPGAGLFDVAVSRATWSVPEWLRRGRAAVRSGGRVLAMEGREKHDLPPGAERHAYASADRERAVIVLPVP